jgi:hypothetical protein
VLEVLKWRFQGLKLYNNLPLITEFQIHILLQSMILYHCFLIWEPQQIKFDFFTALSQLDSRGILGSFVSPCGTVSRSSDFISDHHFASEY